MGEVEVCINYYPGRTADQYAAWFVVGDYRYGLLSKGFSQQDFVDVLLAIINYYGAYPSREGD